MNKIDKTIVLVAISFIAISFGLMLGAAVKEGLMSLGEAVRHLIIGNIYP